MRLLSRQLYPLHIAAQLAHLVLIHLPHHGRHHRVLGSPIYYDRRDRLYWGNAASNERRVHASVFFGFGFSNVLYSDA